MFSLLPHASVADDFHTRYPCILQPPFWGYPVLFRLHVTSKLSERSSPTRAVPQHKT